MVIPGNFVDIETGESLSPAYKFQDAMGIWHEKPLHKCTHLELWNYSTTLWNVSMQHEIELQSALLQVEKANKKASFGIFWLILSITLSIALLYSLVI